MLSNLVANAMQHTPESADVTVRVGTDGDDAVLEVARPGSRHEPGGRVSGSSSGSIAPIPRGHEPAAVPAWGYRLSTRWCARTAVLSRDDRAR